MLQDSVQGTHEILLHYLSRLDKRIHEDGGRKIQQDEQTQYEGDTQISTPLRVRNPKSQPHVCASSPDRQQHALLHRYNVPVKVYDSKNKPKSKPSGPRINSIRPPARTPASTVKQCLVNISHSSPTLGKLSNSLGLLDRSPETLEKPHHNTLVGFAAEAKCSFLPQKTNQPGEQHGHKGSEDSWKSVIDMTNNSTAEENSKDCRSK